jgi:predicted ATP-grasp superfamily ATP-dependent carboligase
MENKELIEALYSKIGRMYVDIEFLVGERSRLAKQVQELQEQLPQPEAAKEEAGAKPNE